jgi:Ca2+-binding EF-hand superfamily protein
LTESCVSLRALTPPRKCTQADIEFDSHVKATMPKKAPINASMQRLSWRRKVEDIGNRMKQKIEIMSGFKDELQQMRKMIDFFLYYDKKASGYLTFESLSTAMKQLNFLGCQRELEAFFNFYDDDCSGSVNYSDMCKELYGKSVDGRPFFEFLSIGTMEQVRTNIASVGGASGHYEFSRLLKSRAGSSSKVTRSVFMDVLAQYGAVGQIKNADLVLVCNAFDPKHENTIDVSQFLNSLIRGTMALERKLIVKQTFFRFQSAQDMGYISISELVSHFDSAYHPEVVAGIISHEEATTQFRRSFSQGGESEGYATLAEYLDYFKGVSLAITDDHAFDMFMRNSIVFDERVLSAGLDLSMSASYSSPTLRRVLVTHTDGKQEVVELLDEMGMGRFDVSTAKDRAREQGVYDIQDLKL